MSKELDQFYTKQEVALKLCEIVKIKLNLNEYIFLEPSAGFGLKGNKFFKFAKILQCQALEKLM